MDKIYLLGIELQTNKSLSYLLTRLVTKLEAFARLLTTVHITDNI